MQNINYSKVIKEIVHYAFQKYGFLSIRNVNTYIMPFRKINKNCSIM